MRKLLYIFISFIFLIFACKKSTPTESTSSDPGPDITAPIITLKGETNYTLTLEEFYIDYGASAMDDRDGDISSKIEISGNVNSTLTGTYIKEYNVKDAVGNVAEKKIRSIFVKNDADNLVGAYNGSCTCTQYTNGIQNPPLVTLSTFSATLVTSKTNNNLITLSSGFGLEIEVRSYKFYSPNPNISGSLSLDKRTINIKTLYEGGLGSFGKQECYYTYVKI